MKLEAVYAALDSLLDYAKNCGLLDALDETFARNALLAELKLESYEKQTAHYDFPACLNLLCDYAAEQGLIHDTIAERDLFDTRLMGCLTPRPSEVVRKFRSLYQERPKAATDYFYKLSQDCNYIRRDRIAKDERWTAQTKYGELEISINLSKPEKDPRDIAAAKLKSVGVSEVSSLRGERRLCGHDLAPGAAESARDAGHGERPAVGLSVFTVCLLQRACHCDEHPAHTDGH